MNQRIKTLFVIFGVFTSAMLAATEVKPVLHASFDQDFRADGGTGKIEGKHSQPITMETLSMLLHPGVKGNAAKIGTQLTGSTVDASSIHYPGKIINPKRGSMAFWLKPMDWDFRDGKFHVFCEASGQDDWLVIYKYRDSSDLYFLYGKKAQRDTSAPYIIVAAPAANWGKNEFRHVAATWDLENIKIYLDGILKATVKIPPGKSPEQFEQFSVGPRGPNAWPNPQGDTLIDELRIYDRPLSASEVEELYTSYGYGKIDKSKIPVKIAKIKMAASPDEKMLELYFHLTRTTQKRIGFPVEMELILNGGKSIFKKILNSHSSEYRYSFKMDALSQGDYELILRPLPENSQDKIETSTHRFTIGKADPVIDRSVPAPWTPVGMVTSDNPMEQIEFSAKMQKTLFQKSIFPVQLTSQNTPLLREPIQFICNNQVFEEFAQAKVIEKQPDSSVIETSGTNQMFDLKVRCRFEFDGMMWFDVTLAPKGKCTIRNAKIIVPLQPEVSSLYNKFHKDYFDFTKPHAGLLRQSVKCDHYEIDELPELWMGNEERGLFYFSENQAGRRLKNRAETVRLDPGANGATFTINLIDYQSELEQPVTWSFGLQATPSRPFVQKRRFWRPGQQVELWFPWEKIHNVPDSRFAFDDYQKMFKTWSLNGKRPVFHYFAGFSISPDTPAYPQNANDWSQTPPAIGTEVSPDSKQWSYVFVCGQSKSYQNTYIQNMKKCVSDLKMQNLYFDNCWSRFCSNSRHGCGWKDEHGKLYPSSSILGFREIAKGVYCELKKQYPQGMIARHISQLPEPPLVSFADCLVDGECFMLNVGKDENYYQVFSPDLFRASFLGRQFGSPSVFIAQFNRAYQLHFPEKLKAAKAGTLKNQAKHHRHFIGYILAHDTHVWPNFGIGMTPFWQIMDNAGVTDDSTFFGYWEKNSPVKKLSPGAERVMVSTYQTKEGALVVLMNDLDQTAEIQLAVDETSFGKEPVIVDVESGNAVGKTTISVSPRDFKLIKITRNR